MAKKPSFFHRIFHRTFFILLCLSFLFSSNSFAQPLEKVPESNYTIAWLSDTQNYTLKYPDIFLSITNFLKNQQDSLHLGYIAMTGDIVDNAVNTKQWQLAKKAMDLLDPIPYGVLAGNHDRNDEIGLKNYQKYFGESFFQEKTYYGGSMKNNRNHFDLINLGETSYLFVYLSYQPGKKDIAWANEIFASYPNHVGVLCVHEYLGKNGSLRKIGERLQNEVVRVNPNLYMVLCGHKTAEGMVPAFYEEEGKNRTVYQMIANYQGLEEGGMGFVRLMEIDEENHTMALSTYSPWRNINADFDETMAFSHPSRVTFPLPWPPLKK